MSCGHQVAVVVIGLNEGERLERCLASIQAMQFPKEKIELIYVDSGSTDGSVEIAKRFGVRVIVIKPEREAPGLARNVGWRACVEPFVLFVDGDSVIHPHFVARALKQFADPSVAVVCGSVQELHPRASIYHRVLDLHWWNPSPGPVAACGGNALIRRSALEEVNGYDGDLIRAEDREMCWRMQQLGYVILRIDFPMVRHDLAMTCWSQYWRRYLYRAYHVAEAAKHLQGANQPHDKELWRKPALAPLIFLGFAGSLGAAVALHSGVPLAAGLFIGVLLIAGAAWRSRERAGDWSTALLCALDFYVATFAWFLGRVLYRYDSLKGQRRELRRYK